ncbi:MAG TPA: flagellar filament capping protein FliD, partial [Spirochaetales bacterium]|nr:flagellar filament capping protein FliD [Spirochaetales bacterium]
TRPTDVQVVESVLTLNPEGEIQIPLTPPLPLNDSMILEAELRLRKTGDGPPAPSAPPVGPAIPDRGDVTLSDVTVRNSPSRVVLPEWKPPEPPLVVDDFNVLFLGVEGEAKPLPPIDESMDFRTIRVPLSSLGNSAEFILLRNKNTYRELEVKSIRLYDPAARGDYRPVQPLSTAQDAELLLNGIPLSRNSNTIDDAVPGITFTLLKAGEQKVKLTVEPDLEKIKDALISFVGTYNRQIAQINVLTRNDEAVLNEITYLEENEREKAREKLGLFQGDISLMQMKNTFQSIMMNPYPTRRGRDLSLLSQIGISTNAQAAGSRSFDITKLRGYLEISESVLDSSLKKDLQAVKDLFGYDTDGDLVPDTGVAVAMDTFIRPHVQTGGIIPLKISTLDSQINTTNRQIESYNQYLTRYEQDLKRKYGSMESALNSLEKSSAALESFNNPGQNNR